MSDVVGLLGVLAAIAVVAVLVVGLMAAGMLAWGFRRTMSRRPDEEEPPEVVELRRQLDGGQISLVEFDERMRALRRRR